MTLSSPAVLSSLKKLIAKDVLFHLHYQIYINIPPGLPKRLGYALIHTVLVCELFWKPFLFFFLFGHYKKVCLLVHHSSNLLSKTIFIAKELMLAPKRYIKHGVGAMFSRLWITWTESHVGCSSKKRGLNPTPVFIELRVQWKRLIRGIRSVI